MFRRAALAMLIVSASLPALAGDGLPANGCYERLYDAAHLKAHAGQFVTEATLRIGPASAEQLKDGKWGIVANADLSLRVRGYKEVFETYGACSVKGGALDCGASISAAEEDQCKSSKPGVHQCRVDGGDAGGFRIETRPEGVVVNIPKRMELVMQGSDTGPYLNLVASDRQNSDFLLMPVAGKCE